MKTRFVTCIAALLVVLLPGCKREPPGQASVQLPRAEGISILNYITEVNDYRQWPFFPDKQPLYPGKHPHGSLLVTYVSPETLNALQSKKGKLPNGAIIIMDNYDLQKKLQATTVMYRMDGYNPGAGDWFWLKYTPNQTIIEEGKSEGCIKCHRTVKDNDWIFSGR